jgi:hypothetical protein
MTSSNSPMLRELLQARDNMHRLLFHDSRATQTDIALAFVRLNNAIHGLANEQPTMGQVHLTVRTRR